jgi:pimeloyl-ACP methyl ester carboxylesterase
MTSAPLPGLLFGLTAQRHATSRLAIHTLLRPATAGGGAPVVFLHGNVSAARFWEETLIALPPSFTAVAPDLRGFGRTEGKPIDATRGLRDFSDDLHALLDETGLPPAKVHLVGWSAGAGVAMQYAINHPERVASLVLVAPMSPYGFGGTKDRDGTPFWPDYAGSGGGAASSDFVERLAARDVTADSPHSPRQILNTCYFKPPFRVAPEREEIFVGEMLSTSTAPAHYPGASVASANWPGVAPGTLGMNNALSPAYCDLSAFAALRPRPRVLWIRGADDRIVSEASLFDLGTLGKLGAVPGWPGEASYPPQPMVSQLRAVLDAYRDAGGSYREEVLAGVGHAPHLEAPDAFRAALHGFLLGA